MNRNGEMTTIQMQSTAQTGTADLALQFVTLWRRYRRQSDADRLNALLYSAGVLGDLEILRAIRDGVTLLPDSRSYAHNSDGPAKRLETIRRRRCRILRGW
jgi:hypothetical protein